MSQITEAHPEILPDHIATVLRWVGYSDRDITGLADYLEIRGHVYPIQEPVAILAIERKVFKRVDDAAELSDIEKLHKALLGH